MRDPRPLPHELVSCREIRRGHVLNIELFLLCPAIAAEPACRELWRVMRRSWRFSHILQPVDHSFDQGFRCRNDQERKKGRKCNRQWFLLEKQRVGLLATLSPVSLEV